MDPDDALIDLLNGFERTGLKGARIPDSVFLDEKGVPTDQFLQALKHDFSSSTSVGSRQSQSQSQSSSKRSFSRDYSNIFPKKDVAYDNSDGHSSEDEHDDSDTYSSEDDDEDSFSTSRKVIGRRADGPQIHSKGTKVIINQGRKQRASTSHPHFLPTTSLHSSLMDERKDRRREREIGGDKEQRTMTKKRSIEKDKGQKQKSATSMSAETRSIEQSQAAPVHRIGSASTSTSTAHKNLLVDDQGQGQGLGFNSSKSSHHPMSSVVAEVDELEPLKLDSDLKIKSLQLRLTGQLQTIRVLETQLADCQHSLTIKTQQVLY
jgi:hypothetical protein